MGRVNVPPASEGVHYIVDNLTCFGLVCDLGIFVKGKIHQIAADSEMLCFSKRCESITYKLDPNKSKTPVPCTGPDDATKRSKKYQPDIHDLENSMKVDILY